MKHLIIAAGKPSLSYAKEGVNLYMKRLNHYGAYHLQWVKDGDSMRVSQRLNEASKGSFRIVLDERGELLTTRQLANYTSQWQLESKKNISYLIGASDGHTQQLRKEADLLLSLSPFTLQHELALLVLSEQLYRIATLLRGEPYHR